MYVCWECHYAFDAKGAEVGMFNRCTFINGRGEVSPLSMRLDAGWFENCVFVDPGEWERIQTHLTQTGYYP